VPEINYLQILKDAWKITWKHKFLWWLGLFSGSASLGINFPTSFGSERNQGKVEDLEKIKDFVITHQELLIFSVITLIAIAILFLIIGFIARGGLIKSIHKISKGEKTGFKAGFKEGKLYFWRILGIGLFNFFSVSFSILVISVPIVILFLNKAYVSAILLTLLGILVFLFIAIVISFMRIFGNIYAVIGDLNLRSSLEKAYELFRNNFAASIIMSLFFIPISLALVLGFIILLVPIILIFFLFGLVLYYAMAQTGIIITVVFGVAFLLIILMAAGSVYQTFNQTVWILFFYEIAKPKVTEEVLEEIKEEQKESIGEPNPIKTSGVEK
jgi:hypothetical protein